MFNVAELTHSEYGKNEHKKKKETPNIKERGNGEHQGKKQRPYSASHAGNP